MREGVRRLWKLVYIYIYKPDEATNPNLYFQQLNKTKNKSEYLAIMDGPFQTFFPYVKSKQNFVKKYINRVVYHVYVVLARKDIDDLFYILS